MRTTAAGRVVSVALLQFRFEGLSRSTTCTVVLLVTAVQAFFHFFNVKEGCGMRDGWGHYYYYYTRHHSSISLLFVSDLFPVISWWWYTRTAAVSLPGGDY